MAPSDTAHGDGTGIISGGHMAYCNHCRWRGIDRTLAESARYDLDNHKLSSEHLALARGQGARRSR